jgi:hypothetical protein
VSRFQPRVSAFLNNKVSSCYLIHLQVFTPALANIVNELNGAFQDWYIPQHAHRHGPSSVHRMQDTLLMRASLRGTPTGNASLPAYLRRAPHTEGYTPDGTDSPSAARSEGVEDDGARRQVSPQLLQLMQLQVSSCSWRVLEFLRILFTPTYATVMKCLYSISTLYC